MADGAKGGGAADSAAPVDPLASLSPTPDDGLSEEEAAARLARFGPNELSDTKQSKLLVALKLVR